MSNEAPASPGADMGGIGSLATMTASKGALVPGKAPVKGDSEKNDIVPILASPGEVVIPKHVMESSDPVKESANFVARLLEEQGKSSGKEHDEFKESLKEKLSKVGNTNGLIEIQSTKKKTKKITTFSILTVNRWSFLKKGCLKKPTRLFKSFAQVVA